MGAPRRNRKKYNKPKNMWNLERIKEDNTLKDQYGLKNMKELWMIQTELSKLRNTVRILLSGAEPNSDKIQLDIITKLSKYGIVSGNVTLDVLLDLKVNAFLDRRLQTVIFKKGLAKTIKQARQLIVHGYIAIEGKRVTKPSYRVPLNEEQLITYYKPINLNLTESKEIEGSKEVQEVASAENIK
ncbi:MAG: 30S ribosomal protein S4 [Candidatus Marsarchaeota archaeon]|nr:30S ribosomal protein S4 [Candidatus Marsarchaeota archaeon]